MAAGYSRVFNRDTNLPLERISHAEFAGAEKLKDYAKIMRGIEASGLTGPLLLFGGALRDAFYGMNANDLDLSPMIADPDDMHTGGILVDRIRVRMTGKVHVSRGYVQKRGGKSGITKVGYNIKGLFEEVATPLQFDWSMPREAYASMDQLRAHRIANASAPILAATMDSEGHIVADRRFLEHARYGIWEPHSALNFDQMADMHLRFGKFTRRAAIQGVDKKFVFKPVAANVSSKPIAVTRLARR